MQDWRGQARALRGTQATGLLLLILTRTALTSPAHSEGAWATCVRQEIFSISDTLDACTKILHDNPNESIAYIGRGRAFQKAGEDDKAIAEFDRAISLDPTSAIAYKNRGSAWNKKRLFDNAIRDLDRSIELDQSDSSTFNARSVARWNRGDYLGYLKDSFESTRIDTVRLISMVYRLFARLF